MKALIVCTSIGSFPSKGTKTGAWLGELVYYYDALFSRKVTLDFASPQGGEIPLDPRSLDSKDELIKAYLQDELFLSKLTTASSLDTINASDYHLLCLVGGHGAIWDFPDHPGLQKIITNIYNNYGTIASVGYGAAALVNVQLTDGSYFVNDRYLTGFSNMEEKLVSFVTEVPFYLEERLVEQGANFTRTMFPFTEHIEMDERLITGQNPNSARKVAQKLVEELWEK